MAHLVFRMNDNYAAIVVSHHRDTTALFAEIMDRSEITTSELISLIRKHYGEPQNCTIVLAYAGAGFFRISDHTTSAELDDDIETSKRAIAHVKSENVNTDITTNTILTEIQNNIDRR